MKNVAKAACMMRYGLDLAHFRTEIVNIALNIALDDKVRQMHLHFAHRHCHLLLEAQPVLT